MFKLLPSRFLNPFIFIVISFFFTTAWLSPVPVTTSPTNLLNQSQHYAVRIPAQAEWVDQGIILKAGKQGEWDYYLWGGFAFSVVKKGDTYYLYYQGSSDYLSGADDTVMWRAIGVATSKDGIHFAKNTKNPVLTWFPTQNCEEGAVSSGITLDEDGKFHLFYGANTEQSATSITADARLATSLDGFNFSDQGVVLRHNDGSVWGSGDELFPVDAIYDQGKWFVYYLPNGTSLSGKLGVAHGDHYSDLDETSATLSGSNMISAWGTAGHVKRSPGEYALILNNVREKRTEVRLISTNAPNKVSEPVAVYQFAEVQQAFILFDADKQTWFMYYRTHDNQYGVKVAQIDDHIAFIPFILRSR
jgi:hypothetical protein